VSDDGELHTWTPHAYQEVGGQCAGECRMCGHVREDQVHQLDNMPVIQFHWPDEAFAGLAATYGIDVDEARQRVMTMMEHTDDPYDPICVGCCKRPHQLGEYMAAVVEQEGIETDWSETDPFDDTSIPESIALLTREYVINEEGTYNPRNGHFLCSPCYIINGSPTEPGGWKCP